MYCSCALATASCDCTTSTVSVTPALKRSRDWVSVCFRQINVAARHVHLIRRRLQVQQRGANVGIDLRAQIVQAFAALLESRIGLQNVAVNAASLKDRNRQRSAHVEYLRCCRGMRSRRAIVRVKGERREDSRPLRPSGRIRLRGRRSWPPGNRSAKRTRVSEPHRR